MFKNKGFTLVEVAIVLVIGGILLAAASALLLSYMKKVQINTTRQKLEAIDEATQLFLNLNGRLPCVANPADLLDSANFGVEIADCTTAPAAPGGRGGRLVRIGAVPVRTLNLPDDYIGDAWSGRFTYAVTEMLAVPGTYDRDQGGVFVVDSANNPVINPAGSAHYVIVSHGPNNAGATSLQGGGVVPCIAGTLDEENCNADATFRSTLLLGTGNTASFYDDFIEVRANSAFGNQIPPGAVLAFNLNACPDGWVPFAGAEERMVIGTGPSYTLGETGGQEDWALTNAQTGFRPSPVTIDPAAIPGTVVFAEGLGVPAEAHENRPPFIALLYCEKT